MVSPAFASGPLEFEVSPGLKLQLSLDSVGCVGVGGCFSVGSRYPVCILLFSRRAWASSSGSSSTTLGLWERRWE